MEKNSRVYTYRGGLFLDYRRKTTDFINEYFDNAPWRIKEYWNVVVRFDKKWWEYEDLYYDGHTVTTVTFCGITIGYGYSYESKSIVNWEKEESANTTT